MFQHYGMTGPFGEQIDHNSVLMAPVTWAWHPNAGAPTEAAPPKEDDEMLTIYWSQPGSTWVADVARLDGTISQGFAVEGRFARYIGERARPGHEGWDDRTTAVRNILAFQGFPDGQREADAPDSLLRTLCLLPDAIPATSGPGVDAAAVVAGLRQPLIDTVTAVLQSQHVDVDEHAVAQAVVDELDHRLAS
jgi:hypothetical protein